MRNLVARPHIILSVENPGYPASSPVSHNVAIKALQRLGGGQVLEIQGHYGKPERSILISDPSDEQAQFARHLAHRTGQESHIESDGYSHKMYYSNGPQAGQITHGRGTTWHEQSPQDFYSKLPSGDTFTHNFDMDKFEDQDKVPGGLADDKKKTDFDPKKLKQGTKVEQEHTSDKKVAEEIASDHLTEDKDYYDKLKEMENKDLKKSPVRSPRKGHTIAQLERLKQDHWHNPDTGTEISAEEGQDHLNQMYQNKADKKLKQMIKPPKAKKPSSDKPEDWFGKAEPAKHSPEIRQHAEEYAASKGLKLQHPAPVSVDPSRGARIAQAYAQMKHEPNHPKVKAAYDALINETMAQFQHLKSKGLKVSSIKQGQPNPYPNGSKDLLHDVRNNKHMWFFPTDQGFGSEGGAPKDHPLLQQTTELHEGKPLLANDIFRIVHDYYGHAKEGHAFGPKGEENAWQNHMQMYSPLAQRALTSETRGQNSWVNFGPHGEQNRANPGQTIYAEQKAGLLPDWVHQEMGTPMGKSEMQKGVARRKFPFNPTIVPESERADVRDWQSYGNDPNTAVPYFRDPQDVRNELASIHPHAKQRGLLKLASKTKTRRHPHTGEREFFLHRGVLGHEHDYVTDSSGYKYNERSSWTPDYNKAKSFTTTSGHSFNEDEERDPEESRPGKVISAWIPESKITHIPAMYGNVDNSRPGKNGYNDEHEIIVEPHGGLMVDYHPNYELMQNPRKQKIQILSQKVRQRHQQKQAMQQRMNAPLAPKPNAKPKKKDPNQLELPLASSELAKASKNVREQRARIFGTDANAPRVSEKRMRMMQQIRDYAQKKYGLPIVTASGKRDDSGQLREVKGIEGQPYDVFTPKGLAAEKKRLAQIKAKGTKRVDPKPDWRSGQLETQPSPDAAVHEVAHLDLAPEGMTAPQFQTEMDRLWGESQSKYGHMQQKKTRGEIQPMAIENPIRRELGLPANKQTKPVKENQGVLDDPTGQERRFVEGKDSKGRTVFYDRQSRLQNPETRERRQQISEGSLKFDPQKGWHKVSDPNALINLRARGLHDEARQRLKAKLGQNVAQMPQKKPTKLAASEDEKKKRKKKAPLMYLEAENPKMDQPEVPPEAAAAPMEKMSRPKLSFPKMGIDNEEHNVKNVATPRQKKLLVRETINEMYPKDVARAAAQGFDIAKVPSIKRLSNKLVPSKLGGANIHVEPSTAPNTRSKGAKQVTYAFSGKYGHHGKVPKKEMTPEKRIEAGQHLDYVRSHEAAHRVMNRVEQVHGRAARHKLLQHLIEHALPDQGDRDVLVGFTKYRGYRPGSPGFDEEMINTMRDVLSHKEPRSHFEKFFIQGSKSLYGQPAPEQSRTQQPAEFIQKLKAGWNRLTQRAGQITHEDVVALSGKKPEGSQ
jgi:hypothetical protein